jgi:hypothetical protein
VIKPSPLSTKNSTPHSTKDSSMLSTKNSNLHSNKDPSLLKNNSNTTNIDPHVRTMHRYLTRSKAARHYQARQSILE